MCVCVLRVGESNSYSGLCGEKGEDSNGVCVCVWREGNDNDGV